jgi:hypothetical protein
LPTNASVFEPFPKLPTELRQLVFKHALPTLTDKKGRRVLQVKGSISVIDEKISRPATFKVHVPYKYSDFPKYPDVYDTGLLGACRESGEVFLKAFPNALQATYGGLIRFDDDTFIHIQNFCEINGRHQLFTWNNGDFTISPPGFLPPYFKSIKKLAMYGRDFKETFLGFTVFDPLFLFPDVDTVSADMIDSKIGDSNTDHYYRSFLHQLTVRGETSLGDLLIEKAKIDIERIGNKSKDLSRYKALEFINWKCEGRFLKLPDRYFRF